MLLTDYSSSVLSYSILCCYAVTSTGREYKILAVLCKVW